MLEQALDKIAEQIIALDEASLTQLRKRYLDRLFQFEPTKEWEKAVIIYFLINGVIAKNNLFNQHVTAGHTGVEPKETDDKGSQGGKGKRRLKIVK